MTELRGTAGATWGPHTTSLSTLRKPGAGATRNRPSPKDTSDESGAERSNRTPSCAQGSDAEPDVTQSPWWRKRFMGRLLSPLWVFDGILDDILVQELIPNEQSQETWCQWQPKRQKGQDCKPGDLRWVDASWDSRQTGFRYMTSQCFESGTHHTN